MTKLLGARQNRLQEQSKTLADTPDSHNQPEPTRKEGQYALEPLEPRLLLSGDPVLAELARWVEDDGSGTDTEALSVIIQEMDQAAAAEMLAGTGADAPDRADLTVSWPDEWSDDQAEPDYLMAAGAPDAPASADSVTQAQLDAALVAAKDAWRDSPLGLNWAILDTITIASGELSGTSPDLLASTTGIAITVDDNAAGRGWFAEGDPEIDRAENIDLLTVVAHEIGHILGQEHVAGAGEVMSSTLAEGVHVLPGDSAALNDVIDAVLAGFGGTAPMGEQVFMTAPGQAVTIGSTLNDGKDLELEGVTLRFSNLNVVAGAWTGSVVIEATSGTLFSGLLDIALVDDGTDTAAGNDADEFALTGTIDLADASSTLALDDFALETFGLPALFTFSINQISVNFDNFRASDEINELRLNLAIDAIDTGNAEINNLLKSEFGFALKIDADLDLTLDVDEVEAAAQAAIDGDAVAAIEAAFAKNVVKNINAIEIGVDGTFPGIGSFSGKFIYAVVNGDGVNTGESAEYLAIDASIALTPEFLGIEVKPGDPPPVIPAPKFGFAISSLGPLQAYIGGENTLPDIIGQGYKISGLNVGVRFSTSIEGLQTDVDYNIDTTQVSVDGDQITLTLEGHDFGEGDELRLTHENLNFTVYNGVYSVDSFTADTITYTTAVETPITAFSGNAEIIRLTITDPLDLRDGGLASGILPPADVDPWKIQLDNAVKQQIADGASWLNVGNLLDNVILGGGGTVSFTGIEADVLKVNASVLLGLQNLTTPEDLKVSLFLAGTLVVNDAIPDVKFEAPARLFGKFDASTVEARFLILADLPGTNAAKGITPIMVLRGEATFAAMGNGFEIDYTGGVDLYVPNPAAADPLTTITLEGNVKFTFSVEGDAARIDLEFHVSLTETFAGLIGLADGRFHLLVVTDADGDVSDVQVWGAAILTVDDSFLNEYGLYTDVAGLIKINTTSSDKPDESLTNSDKEPVDVTLPASTFALRLDGDVDFKISGTTAFEIDGTFVLELSGAQGFNVAIFSEEGGVVDTASLKIGPDGFLEYNVLGFLAIRSDGIAASLGLARDIDLFGLADLKAAAVLVINTTGRRIEFTVPPSPNADLGDVPTIFTIPAAAPQNPSAVLAAPSNGSGDLGLTALLDGSPTWAEGAVGPYAVVFIEGDMTLLDVLEFDVSGYVLLSSSVFSLEASFYAGGDFLGLASGSVSGSLFFSSQGEFEVVLDAGVRLGPDWIYVSGDADLTINYLDDDGKGSAEKGTKELNIYGSLSVGVNIDIDPFPAVSLSPPAFTVAYSTTSGAITIGVPYPEPFWDEECADIPLVGEVCVPFPNVRDASYTFTVGTLLVIPPPPIVLAHDDNNDGILEVNAGVAAAARNLLFDEKDEDVTIEIITKEFEGVDVDYVAITMFGVTQEFKDVNSVLIVDMLGGNDTVVIDDSVYIPVEVHFGDGRDALRSQGNGVVTAYGDGGKDRLEGGRAGDILDGGADDDIIDGGLGEDSVSGGIGDGSDTFIWNIGDGADTSIVGGGGSDLLRAIGRNGQALVAEVTKAGSAFDVAVGGVTMRASQVEQLNITGRNEGDTVTINDLTGSVLNRVDVELGSDSLQDTVEINTTETGDRVDVATASVTLPGKGLVDATQIDVVGKVTVNIYDAGLNTGGDTFTVNTLAGDDEINLKGALEGTLVNLRTGADADTINLLGLSLNAVDDIDGLIDVDGGSEDDTINLLDSGSVAAKDGALTSNSIRGLGMATGVDYVGIEDMTIRLGTGSDTFFIDSTHSGTTTLHAGVGIATAGQRDDTIAINTISGTTTVMGEGGNDAVHVNVNADLTRTHLNGIGEGDELTIDGGNDSDDVTVNLAGNGDAIINVHDTGGDPGKDTLTINGADTGSSYGPNDTFLLRKDFVALINGGDVERVNYNSNINEGLFVNGLAGDDKIVADDNSTITTLDGGIGDDTFQIGQVFATPRDVDANVGAADEFDTTPIILGVIKNPDPGSEDYELNQVIFDPSTFDVLEDTLPDGITADIAAAVTYQKVSGDGSLDGLAYVSDGVSYETTILGGDDDDDFNVYHNKAVLNLEGDDGNDDFIVRAFVTVALPGFEEVLDQAASNLAGGAGADAISYAANAPVNIDGGDGFDTLVVLGTPFGDNFVVTADRIYGAGLSVSFENIESVEVDSMEGNDTIYVLGTNSAVVTTVIGGQGSDAINVMGDVVKPIAGGITTPDFDPIDQNLDQISGPLILEGGMVEGKDRSLQQPIVLPGESDDKAVQSSPTRDETTDTDTLNVFHTDNSAAESGELLYRGVEIENKGLALTGFGMGGDHTVSITAAGVTTDATYGGGITLNGFESVEVLLGSGDETLVIKDTADRDEKESADPDPATITVIHGGGGSDNITINGRGNGPLVVYGDTSEDGSRYSNADNAASVNGSSFDTPDNYNDTIDASGLAAKAGDSFVGVVIYGGDGDDTITGSQGDDQLAGGSDINGDTINGEEGNDTIYGDSHFNVSIQNFTEDQQGELADDQVILSVVTSGDGGADMINGGLGADVIFGDHGIVTQLDVVRPIETTDNLVSLETTDLTDGDADTIHGDEGNDIVFGGIGGDTIDGDTGNDLILGDHGSVDQTAGTSRTIESTVGAEAGDYADTIHGNDGNDIVFGGDGGDTIDGNLGSDLIFGDHGLIEQNDQTTEPGRIDSTDHVVSAVSTSLANGGVDTIRGNEGNDIVFGGIGGDMLYGDLGNDLILGDHGLVTANDDPEIDLAKIGEVEGAGVDNAYAAFFYTSDTSVDADASAGGDTIYGGSQAVGDTDTGDNIILGQQGGDTIYGGGSDDDIYGGHNVANGTDGDDFIDGAAGNDVILGDNGRIERTAEPADPRFTELDGSLIYDSNDVVNDHSIGANPADILVRAIDLFDHDDSNNNVDNFGDDTIAGGADDDIVFGQLGDDTLHGDGMLTEGQLESLDTTIANSDVGGDDYIEGNGGSDTVYGGLGQDDIIGGSSSLYGLDSTEDRPDGADALFGGNGDLIDRNEMGADSHSRDADMILGDNGNIYRLVDGQTSLSFTYDHYAEDDAIVVRAAELLDYTLGGAATETGAGDEIHGESGDDFIYGMSGDDVLFGDAQDDDLIGGTGNDWISGGTGTDGVLGDDGRIYTSRNGESESLYGLEPVVVDLDLDAGTWQQALVNVDGELTKSVNLTPFDLGGNDIIYGGLGDDFLHGGAGDDAMSGAEALQEFYDASVNPGNVLGYDPDTEEFAAYNEDNPWQRVMVNESGAFTTDGSGSQFLLNFEFDDSGLFDSHSEGTGFDPVPTDGDDRIFGDNGNDWLVGGTGRDHLYGGLGSDMLNVDDDHDSSANNDDTEEHPSYDDIAFGGAGRDVLISNTANDRMIDWNGEYNSYIVPFSAFGIGTVTRAQNPALRTYLAELAEADGADQSLTEPDGELGLTTSGQTGSPGDPQNVKGGGKR